MANSSHHYHHKFHNLNHKNTFLPMLCSKPSIKDVRIPRLEDRSASFSDDPLSPKVGCMGQVKRNNRVGGFPPPHTGRAFVNKTVKYSKLKKLFSGKNLLSATTTTPSTTTTTTTKSAKGGGRTKPLSNCHVAPRKSEHQHGGSENSMVVVVPVDMDPPLPVIKKVRKPEKEGCENQMDSENMSLWNRRSKGVSLKTLELQQIQNCPRLNYTPQIVTV